jgi:hypothetical protein
MMDQHPGPTTFETSPAVVVVVGSSAHPHPPLIGTASHGGGRCVTAVTRPGHSFLCWFF